MVEKIRLEMSDWLYNAGLVGLYNILKHAEETIEIKEQYMEFDISVLNNFEEKYFRYLIDKYEQSLSWHKIVSYESTIRYHENTDFEFFGEDDLEFLNKYIKDTVKYYLNSASYKATYNLFNDEIDILDFAKGIEIVKLKKNEKINEKISDIKIIFDKLKTVINFCRKENHKKYLAGKNVIYTIIKNAWDGVCFLNPQTKEKDIYSDYKNYFVEPVIGYITSNKTKFKYNCFNCNREMKGMDNDLSFLNNVGFDVNKKSSHVWNFSNDIAVCPLCKLVYSCTPAGITYVYDRGIYINDNQSLERLININNKVKNEILKEHELDRTLTYKALVNSMMEQFHDNLKYELADIQVIRYENEKYRFNLLSKRILEVVNKSRDDLNDLINSSYKEVNTYFYIYEIVIDRILNNQNLFTLIHKLLVYKLSNPQDCKFGTSHLIKIMRINYRILEAMGYMENTDKDIIKLANSAGYYLREKYKDKGAQDKLNGIAYRLLNALKTSNSKMFMDTILNCYLYCQMTVPSIFLEALKDDEKYKTIGYAFVTGLIEGKENSNIVEGENNSEK